MFMPMWEDQMRAEAAYRMEVARRSAEPRGPRRSWWRGRLHGAGAVTVPAPASPTAMAEAVTDVVAGAVSGVVTGVVSATEVVSEVVSNALTTDTPLAQPAEVPPTSA